MDIQPDEEGQQNNNAVRPPSINYFYPSIKSRKSNESNFSGLMGSTQLSPYPQKMSLQSNISEKAKSLMVQQDLFESLAGQKRAPSFGIKNRPSYNQFKISMDNRPSDLRQDHIQNKVQAPQRISIQGELTEEKPITCRCSKSKCLLMYCQCFSKGIVCNKDCSCYQCRNNEDFEEKRQKARQSVLERDPNAFNNKFQLVGDEKNVNMGYKRGCNCKKTLCFKKYCECFLAGVKCSYLCKCENCMNGGQNAFKQ